MKQIAACLLILFLFTPVAAQTAKEDYTIVLSTGETLSVVHKFRGDSFFRIGQVKKAIAEYRLQNKEKYGICKYELACALAKDNQFDSAFYYLNLNLTYDHTHYVMTNPDFFPMMDDPRWAQLQNRWIDSTLKENPGGIKNVPLAKILWKMAARDQAYYYELQVINSTMFDCSALSKTFWRLKEDLNRINHSLLDSIVRSSGWPKISEVGDAASSGAFLVVQHMDLTSQLNYLPLIESACGQKEANWDKYAFVFDRVCVQQNKPQYYGTQLEVDKKTGQLSIYPIEDEENVNARRKAFGMDTIEEYAKMVGFMHASPVKSK